MFGDGFQEYLFGHPGRVALVLTSALLVTFGFLVLGIEGYHPIGGVSAPETVTDALDALVAIGTLSLAYAAGFQAISTERARAAGLRPNLNIQFLGPHSGESGADPARPLMLDTYSIDVTGRTELQFAVVNMGPGNAVDVKVYGPFKMINDHGPWEVATTILPEAIEAHASTPSGVPTPYYVVVEGKAIRSNDDYRFGIPIAYPFTEESSPIPGAYRLVGSMRLTARCKDVEGNVSKSVSLLLLLHQISPYSHGPGADRLEASSGGTVHGYKLLWSVSNEAP